MFTPDEIIEKARERIGGYTKENPDCPETTASDSSDLDSILASWISQGIINEAGDERVGITSAIISNLASHLAVNYDVWQSIGSAKQKRLADAANRDLNTIKRLYQKIDIPNLKFSLTLPMGAGNRSGGTFYRG